MLITAAIVLVVSNLVDLSAIASVGSACSPRDLPARGYGRLPVAVVDGAPRPDRRARDGGAVVVLCFFAVDTLPNAPETFVAIVAIAVLAVLLDAVWKRIAAPART